jgi:hypothetical protein
MRAVVGPLFVWVIRDQLDHKDPSVIQAVLVFKVHKALAVMPEVVV